MSSFLLRNVAFSVDNCNNLTYTEDRAVSTEHLLYCTVNRTWNFNDRFVVLYFHYDIFVCHFVADFDVHFNNFAFMQSFAKLWESIFKFCHLDDLLFYSIGL
ncbi:hypothetical protein D3C71_1881720 [compost metagenome]